MASDYEKFAQSRGLNNNSSNSSQSDYEKFVSSGQASYYDKVMRTSKTTTTKAKTSTTTKTTEKNTKSKKKKASLIDKYNAFEELADRGVTNFLNSVWDWEMNQIQAIAKKTGNKKSYNAAQKVKDAAQRSTDLFNNSVEERFSEGHEKDYGILENTSVQNAVTEFGRQVIPMGVGAVAGMAAESIVAGNAAISAVQAEKKIRRASKIATYTAMGAGVAGNATQEALDEGYSYDKAIKAGYLKAANEIITEEVGSLLSGGIAGVGGHAGGEAGEVIGNAVSRNVKNQVLRYITNWATREGIEVVGEIGEELLGNVLDNLVDKHVLDKEVTDVWGRNDMKETAEVTFYSTLMMRVLTGGFIQTGVDVATDEHSTKINQQAKETITEKLSQKEINKLQTQRNAEAVKAQQIADMQPDGAGTTIAVSDQRKGSSTTESKEEAKKKLQTTIDEANKDGVVTEEEKAEIKKQIQERIDKGELTAEEIYEALGGEATEQLQEAETIQQEIEQVTELLNDDSIGVGQKQSLQERLEELQAKYDSFNTDELKAKQMQNALNSITQESEIYKSLINEYRKNSTLSLNEQHERWANSESAQNTIRNLKLAGANDSEATRVMGNTLAQISKDTNVTFDFVKNANKEGSAWYNSDGTITIDVSKITDSGTYYSVVAHEIYHAFKQMNLSEEYNRLVNSYLEQNKEIAGKFIKEFEKKYPELLNESKKALYEEEKIANFTERLLADEEFVKSLAQSGQISKFQKFINAIKSWINDLIGKFSSENELDKNTKVSLEQLKDAFTNMYKEASKLTNAEREQRITPGSENVKFTKTINESIEEDNRKKKFINRSNSAEYFALDYDIMEEISSIVSSKAVELSNKGKTSGVFKQKSNIDYKEYKGMFEVLNDGIEYYIRYADKTNDELEGILYERDNKQNSGFNGNKSEFEQGFNIGNLESYYKDGTSKDIFGLLDETQKQSNTIGINENNYENSESIDSFFNEQISENPLVQALEDKIDELENNIEILENKYNELDNSSFSLSEIKNNSNDITNIKTGYENVSNNLLGFSNKTSADQKNYFNQNYKYNLDLYVSIDGGKTFFEDSIKGLNKKQAIERAKRNWQDAIIREKTDDNIYYSKTDNTLRDKENTFSINHFNSDKLKSLAKELDTSYSFLDANMEDNYNKNESEIKHNVWFLEKHTNIVDKFLKDNNIEITDDYIGKEKELAKQNGYDEWVNNLVSDLYEENTYDIDDIMEEAKFNHGTTDYFEYGAYMTTDGELLDFDDGGYRDDHRTIDAYDLSMQDFIDAGAIRMKPEGSGIEMSVEPTNEQYDKLYDYVEYLKEHNEDRIYIEAGNDGEDYSLKLPTSTIIDNLKEYWRVGEFPKSKSEFADFYYSKTDNQDNSLSNEQQDFFKNVAPEVRDEEGRIKVLYHGSNDAGFTIFNDYKGNGNYRYGSYDVTFLTDSEDVSRTYTGGTEYVDTKKITSDEDVLNWLNSIEPDTEFRIVEDTSNYDGRKIYRVLNEYDESIIDEYSKEDLYKNLKREYQKRFGDTKAGGVYQVYAQLENPYVVEGKSAQWNMIEHGVLQDRIDAIKEMPDGVKEELYNIAKESFNNRLKRVEAKNELYEEFSKLEKEFNDLFKKENKTIEEIARMTEISKKSNELHDEWNYTYTGSNYTDFSNNSRVQEIIDMYFNAYDMYPSFEELYGVAYTNFDEETMNNVFSQIKTTNEIVKDVIYKNDELLHDYFEKTGRLQYWNINDIDYGENWLDLVREAGGYDGVVFKNIYDTGNYGYDAESNVYVAFSSKQVKAIDNTTPTSDLDIRYSKTDNTGRELTEGQNEYFINSKARVRENVNNRLMKVYHTTTDMVEQFNEFNPTGTSYYRFGNQIVNYYTDDKDMSGSYANSNLRYEMANGKRYTSMSELQYDLPDKYRLREIGNGKYGLFNNQQAEAVKLFNEWYNTNVLSDKFKNGINELSKYYNENIDDMNKFLTEQMKQVLVDGSKSFDTDIKIMNNTEEMTRRMLHQAYSDFAYETYNNKKEEYGNTFYDSSFTSTKLLEWLNEGSYHEEPIRIYDSKEDALRKVPTQTKDFLQYEGYTDIQNPYIVDAEGRNWDKVEIEDYSKLRDKLVNIRENKEVFDKLYKLAEESHTGSMNYMESGDWNKYTDYFDFFKNIKGADLKENIDLISLFGGDYTTIDETNEPSGDTNVYDLLYTEGFIKLDDYKQMFQKSIPLDMTLDEYVREYGRLRQLNSEYGENDSYFLNHYKEIIPEDIELSGQKLFVITASKFSDEIIKKQLELYANAKSTNDIVKQVLGENNKIIGAYDFANNNFESLDADNYVERVRQAGGYDGVIIKQVKDYGHWSDKLDVDTPHNLYITFGSEQFKSIENENPTSDRDWRYSKSENTGNNPFFNVSTEPVSVPETQEQIESAIPIAEDYINEEYSYTEDDLNNITREEPMEETEYYEDIQELTDENLNRIVKSAKKNLGLTREQTESLKNKVRDMATDENFVEEDVYDVIEKMYNNSVKVRADDVIEAQKYISQYTIQVPDRLKAEFGTDYVSIRNKLGNKLRLRENGTPIDKVYQELLEMNVPYIDAEITNEGDQLRRLIDIANMDKTRVEAELYGGQLEDFLSEEASIIYSDIASYKYNQRAEEAKNIIKALEKDAKTIPEVDLSDVSEDFEGIDFPIETDLEMPLNEQLEDVKLTGKEKKLDSVNKQIAKYTQMTEKIGKKLDSINQTADDLRNGLGATPMEQWVKEQAAREIEISSAKEAEKYVRYVEKLQELTERKNKLEDEIANSPVKKTHKAIQRELINDTGILGESLDNANEIPKLVMNNTDAIRLQTMIFGQELGNKLNKEIFQKVKDNEALSIKWQNEQRDRIKKLGIKAGSYESEIVQKFGEGEITEAQLFAMVPDDYKRTKIRNAVKQIRGMYDEYLELTNAVLTNLGYDAIPKRQDYFRHFQELGDIFSRFGIPFNLQAMNENNIPTDKNGLTADFKPGKNFFASALHRKGFKTTYDAIKGIDGYISGVSNLIYHTEDINRLRGFDNYIREIYGQEHGFDNIENLTETERLQRIEKIQNNYLSNYAAWLTDYTNILAGKKSMLDRGLEAIVGRRVYSILDTANKQVGINMVGGNVSSALTNFIAYFQALGKTNKIAAIRGLSDSVANIFRNDGFVDKNGFLTSRYGTDMLSKTLWQKIGGTSMVFMEGIDHFVSNAIVRSKYYELKSKGYSDSQAHAEAGMFGAKILGDRSKGAMPTIFNSKVFGATIGKFQYEASNQLYSMFYDTYNESKEQANGNAVMTTAGMVFTIGQMAVFTHLFGKAFEKVAGYNPVFDLVEAIRKMFGADDDEDSEDTTFDNIMQGITSLVEQLPYISLFTNGRSGLPIQKAFNGLGTAYKAASGGTDNYGNEITWEDARDDLLDSAAYWLLPAGYGQLKKTYNGLNMYYDLDASSEGFLNKRELAGSYTDSGNLRYEADDSTMGILQSAIFGKWANQSAQDYIDSGFKTIDTKTKTSTGKEKKSDLQKMQDYGMTSSEFRNYKSGLSLYRKKQDKIDYIMDLNVDSDVKDKMLADIGAKATTSSYKGYNSYEEYTYAEKNPTKYKTITQIADYDTYSAYKKELEDIRNNTSNDKEETIKYINSLNMSIPQKAMFIKMYYKSFKSYDSEIVTYINNQSISIADKTAILEQLGYTIKDGVVYY